jgi:hypothetical protein
MIPSVVRSPASTVATPWRIWVRRLCPRALLEQDELAAFELAGPGQDRHRLQRERHIAVEILVEGVVTAGSVAQDQRRGTLLSGAATAIEEGIEAVRVAPALVQAFGPDVGQLGKRRVEGMPDLVDQRRQRSVEVLVLAFTEPQSNSAVFARIAGKGVAALIRQ